MNIFDEITLAIAKTLIIYNITTPKLTNKTIKSPYIIICIIIFLLLLFWKGGDLLKND